MYPIMIIIWSITAQLGLEESSEAEGFRRPKYAQKSDVVIGYISNA